MSSASAPDIFARLGAEVGECPVYDEIADVLYVVDIPAGVLWACSMDGATRSVRIGSHLGCVALVEGGGFLLGSEAGLARLSSWDSAAEPWVVLEPDDRAHCNDGACAPDGRFVVGTVATDGSPDGRLHLVGPLGEVSTLASGIGMSNGVGWSPDGRHLYHADSTAGTVTRWQWDAGEGRVGSGTTIIALPSSEGLPDGLAMDHEGHIWLAVWGAGEVRRYDGDGRRLGTISFPTPQVSSCAFGGPEGDVLFVTSAAVGLDPGDVGSATAGSVFAVDPGTAGPPPTRFRGGDA